MLSPAFDLDQVEDVLGKFWERQHVQFFVVSGREQVPKDGAESGAIVWSSVVSYSSSRQLVRVPAVHI